MKKYVFEIIYFFSTLTYILKLKIRLCTENIEWAKNENRTFLRQALEV